MARIPAPIPKAQMAGTNPGEFNGGMQIHRRLSNPKVPPVPFGARPVANVPRTSEFASQFRQLPNAPYHDPSLPIVSRETGYINGMAFPATPLTDQLRPPTAEKDQGSLGSAQRPVSTRDGLQTLRSTRNVPLGQELASKDPSSSSSTSSQLPVSWPPPSASAAAALPSLLPAPVPAGSPWPVMPRPLKNTSSAHITSLLPSPVAVINPAHQQFVTSLNRAARSTVGYLSDPRAMPLASIVNPHTAHTPNHLTARALPTANGAAPLKRGSQAETLHIPNAESTMRQYPNPHPPVTPGTSYLSNHTPLSKHGIQYSGGSRALPSEMVRNAPVTSQSPPDPPNKRRRMEDGQSTAISEMSSQARQLHPTHPLGSANAGPFRAHSLVPPTPTSEASLVSIPTTVPTPKNLPSAPGAMCSHELRQALAKLVRGEDLTDNEFDRLLTDLLDRKPLQRS